MVTQKLTKDWLDSVLSKYENEPTDSHAYGVVTSINADGSYQVQLNSSSERARCAAFCSASLGDKVVVLIFSDGRAAAIATLGGEGGGGGSSSDMAYTVLFAPDEGTTEDFSLNESAGNFEMLEIQYTDGLRHMTKRVFQPNGKAVVLDRSVANSELGFFAHSVIATISGSSVTLSNHGGLYVTVNDTPGYQNIETIKVTAVLGWSNATEFPNPSNYYLKAEVDTAIEEAVASIDVPDVDLTNYYTKAETDAQIAAHVPEIDLSAYYTSEQVDQIVADALASLHRVPADYTVLDYIYSDGTGQYVNTGISPNQDTRLTIDLYPEDNGVDVWMFEGRTSGSTNRFGVYCQYTLTPNRWYSDYGASRIRLADSESNGRILVDANKNVVTVNGQTVEHEYEAFQSTTNLYLLCNNTAGTTKGYVQGKLYSCQIYDDGLPVRDFVPVRKKSTLEVGLYDRVGGVFYGNAGEGTFTAG